MYNAAGVTGRAIDIAPNDPLIAYVLATPAPVDVDRVRLDSPALEALREAGVKIAVPLVSQGELVGMLNLGPRRSDQEYSADDRKLLENLAAQAAPAVRVAQMVKENEASVRGHARYEQEMKVAQLIQQNFLPRELPEPDGWTISPYYQPARQVGGDFYDVLPLPDGRLGVLVGDVTDKGVPAALVMASTRSVLRLAARRFIEPGSVLQRVNDQLVPEMPPKMFVTCLYGVLDPRTGRFVFANAGHNLPCVRAGGNVVETRATGMPLGLLSGMAYSEAEVIIHPGDGFLLYSDGLTEAHSPDDEMFGFPGVHGCVGRPCSGQEMIDHLMTELRTFTGPHWEQEDDITMLAVMRAASSAAHELELEGSSSDSDERHLIRIEVPSEPGREREVIAKLEPALLEVLPAGRIERMKTAVAEGTMNAIEHGNHNDASIPVIVDAFIRHESLVVRIIDRGSFDGEEQTATAPDLDLKLAGLQTPRGWGLFLIRNMVDEVRVGGDDDHHTLDLVMHLKESDDNGPV